MLGDAIPIIGIATDTQELTHHVGLNKKTAVNGFMRHMHGFVIRKLAF